MKNLKKIMAVLIAAVMVFAMGITVFGSTADGEPADTTTISTSITVDLPSGDTTPHTYNVYQIFTGDVVNGKLTKIQYGTGHKSYSSADGANNYVPKSVLDTISDEAAVRTYAKSEKGTTVYGTVIEGGAPLEVPQGYYLLEDVSYTGAGDDAFSAIIVQVVGDNVTITPKRVKPTVDKEVQDEVADAEAGATEGWGETADHEIGESFQFRLTATLPASPDYAQYQKYEVTFNDTMSAGVTFESIASVTVDGVAITNYTLSQNAVSGAAGITWTLKIDDVKAITGVDLADGADIIVVYNAHLNSAAEVNIASGDTDNENKVSLTYSNNPDATGSGGTNTTEEDHVWVFTYGNNGTKEDAKGEKLPGAGFTLHIGTADGAVVPLYKVGNDYYVYNAANASAYTGGALAEKNEMITTTDGIFNIKGLDVGTYVLVESTVPAGYVEATPTTFTITANHIEDAAGVPYVDLGTSKTSETIVNYTGTTLPSTGGIGTTIFYIIGGVIVLAAVIILVVRSKKSSAK